MKKLFIILFWCFLIQTVEAQIRMGYSISQIREEFSDSKYELYSANSGDDFCIIINFVGIRVYYFFDKDGYTDANYLIPLTSGKLQGLIENYNRYYVIISDTEWKYYNSNGVLYIKLAKRDDGESYISVVINH